MSVQQDLLDLGDLFNFCDLSTFTQNIPIEWVASALDLSSQATIRRRRLPADQVLWLVLGMALFRDEPVHEVARRLNICAQGLASDHLLARSGVTESRKRLGADPIEWLFHKTVTQWGAERYDDDAWHDLQVFAVDGALLRTPDTPELRDHFGSGNTSTDRQTPFPMLSLVALFDKGFWGADLLSSLSRAGTNRHWLIPAKKGLVCEEVARYSQHDRLLRMKVSPQARKRNPALPSHWEVREVSYEIQGKVKTVMTSLPAKSYNTQAVAKLYQERWEIQGYQAFDAAERNDPAQQKVELIYQEVWGLLLAYNVIRREASQAAVAFGRAPSDIRFKPVCQYIAVQLIVMAAANPVSATGRRLAELRAGIGGLFLDHRPRPSRPRTVKISKTRFPVDRKAAPLR